MNETWAFDCFFPLSSLKWFRTWRWLSALICLVKGHLLSLLKIMNLLKLNRCSVWFEFWLGQKKVFSYKINPYLSPDLEHLKEESYHCLSLLDTTQLKPCRRTFQIPKSSRTIPAGSQFQEMLLLQLDPNKTFQPRIEFLSPWRRRRTFLSANPAGKLGTQIDWKLMSFSLPSRVPHAQI